MAGFAAALQARTAEISQQIDEVVRESVIGFARVVIPRSPVDTGAFRTNWLIGIGGVNRSTTPETDRSGQLALRQIEFTLGAWETGQTIFLTNSLDYGRALEYGYSKQAPQGFNRVTAAEWPLIVRAALAKAQSR